MSMERAESGEAGRGVPTRTHGPGSVLFLDLDLDLDAAVARIISSPLAILGPLLRRRRLAQPQGPAEGREHSMGT